MKKDPESRNYGLEESSIYKEYKKYLEELEDTKRSYITNRVINQIIWYDTQATNKQRKYKGWTIAAIVMTAIIPCLSLLTACRYGVIASVMIAILSGFSSAAISIVNLCELQKLWIEYRTNCEILKSVLYRYLTKTGTFYETNSEQAFHTLITMVEEYMIQEYKTWSKLHESNEINNK